MATGATLTSEPPVFINTPLSPGNPYIHSETPNGFGAMGKLDIAATLAAVAREAINVVWFQKWWVHLRHRPESGGAPVYSNQTGQGNTASNTVSIRHYSNSASRTPPRLGAVAQKRIKLIVCPALSC
ncbi:MAG TPA: hypothetical protein VKV17_16330 [Bryobacteraceae bacterium]|nr:hypothetical protein [Bryobacteraceae bacterium]